MNRRCGGFVAVMIIWCELSDKGNFHLICTLGTKVPILKSIVVKIQLDVVEYNFQTASLFNFLSHPAGTSDISD